MMVTIPLNFARCTLPTHRNRQVKSSGLYFSLKIPTTFYPQKMARVAPTGNYSFEFFPFARVPRLLMTKCTKNSYNTVTENERFIQFRLNDIFRDAVSLILRESASLENENATILHPSNLDLLMQSPCYQFSVRSSKS